MCNSQVTALGLNETYKLSGRDNPLGKLNSCLCTWVLLQLQNLYIMMIVELLTQIPTVAEGIHLHFLPFRDSGSAVSRCYTAVTASKQLPLIS